MRTKLRRRDFLKAVPTAAAGTLAGTAMAAEGDSSREGSPLGMVREQPRETPVVHECDVCVVGGSCTGVFAAVAAAVMVPAAVKSWVEVTICPFLRDCPKSRVFMRLQS